MANIRPKVSVLFVWLLGITLAVGIFIGPMFQNDPVVVGKAVNVILTCLLLLGGVFILLSVKTLKAFIQGGNLYVILYRVKRSIPSVIKKAGGCCREIYSFGAVYIDPKVLCICIITRQDKERDYLIAREKDILIKIKDIMRRFSYPETAINDWDGLIFESQETVDREYSGSWYYRFK